MIAIGYTRVSTPGQSDEGLSLEDQAFRIRAWAAAHGYELHARPQDVAAGLVQEGTYCDAGFSASRADNRKALQAAVDLACASHAPLVVYDLSRFARSLPDAVALLGRLTKAKAQLVSLVEGIDTTTATGELMYGVLSAVNQFVARCTRDRTRAIVQHKQSRGEYIGGQAPYGSRAKDGAIVPDEDEQRVIGMVRFMRREGTTAAGIARRLNAMHVPCRGSAWHPKTVSRLIARERVA
jgi:DNA invertase Pin-like site-specific DNA recombinase